jgi:hypothetical protein
LRQKLTHDAPEGTGATSAATVAPGSLLALEFGSDVNVVGELHLKFVRQQARFVEAQRLSDLGLGLGSAAGRVERSQDQLRGSSIIAWSAVTQGPIHCATRVHDQIETLGTAVRNFTAGRPWAELVEDARCEFHSGYPLGKARKAERITTLHYPLAWNPAKSRLFGSLGRQE